MCRPDKLIPHNQSTGIIVTYRKAKHTTKKKQSGNSNQNQKLMLSYA